MLSNFLRLRTSSPQPGSEQRVGWLELFFDLVYVATIVALGDKLSHDLSLKGVATFALLFVPIWWSWAGIVFYVTRFNLDDVGHRLLIFAEMFAVSMLAITIEDGVGHTSRGFALAYVGARTVLVVMYWRAGQIRPQARPLTRRYASGFALAALVWLISAAVPPPARFLLWGIALVIDFGTPLLPSTRRLQAEAPPDTHHLPERFGLFTIIVLGEAFIKVITGASVLELELINALYGAFALVIAASLWWIYFDNVKGSVVRRTRYAGQVWVYTHLPLLAALTAFGVASKKIVLIEPGHGLDDEKRLLLAGAVSVALLAIAILDLATTEDSRDLGRGHSVYVRAAGAAFVLGVALVGGALNAGPLLFLIAVACVVQVGIDLYRNIPKLTSTAPNA